MEFGEKRTRSHANNHVLRDFPAELLNDFKAHALRSFCIVRANVHIHECPTIFSGNFATKAIDLIISAVDPDYIGAKNEATQDFTLFKIRRNRSEERRVG